MPFQISEHVSAFFEEVTVCVRRNFSPRQIPSSGAGGGVVTNEHPLFTTITPLIISDFDSYMVRCYKVR